LCEIKGGGKEHENETGISPENEMLCFSGRSREGLDEIVTEEVVLLVLMEDEMGGWEKVVGEREREKSKQKQKRRVFVGKRGCRFILLPKCTSLTSMG
jgi:hypothetical protein